LQKFNFLQVLPYGEDLGGVLSVTEPLELSSVEISRSAEKGIKQYILKTMQKHSKHRANIDFYALFVTNATNKQLTITKPIRKEKRKKSPKSKKRTN